MADCGRPQTGCEMAQPHIQVIVADEQIPASLHTALQRTSATAAFWPLSEALRSADGPRGDAVVVVVPDDLRALADPLQALFERLAEHPRATVVVGSDGQSAGPLALPPTLPVTFFRGEDAHELSGRLAALLEMRGSLESLQRNARARPPSGESLAAQYSNQLRLASQVQREFLPDVLPQFGPVSFELLFRPVDYVSGDIYDVRRLDETHVGIALADATGHGIPAALLTVYIKRALRGKEIENGAYRILSPDEVLRRLNDDLLEAGLTECPFVAAVYAVLNTHTLRLSLARAGAPYPLHRSANGDVEPIVSGGSVVGVLPHADFEVTTVPLAVGDSVIFHSDGLERIVVPETFRSGPTGRAAPAIADPVHSSPWCALLRHCGPSAALRQLADRHRTLRRMGYPLDDLTVLCLHVGRLTDQPAADAEPTRCSLPAAVESV